VAASPGCRDTDHVDGDIGAVSRAVERRRKIGPSSDSANQSPTSDRTRSGPLSKAIAQKYSLEKS
jgi:hypothetical protein